MDKRLVYIVLGTLVSLYLVGRKAFPETLHGLQVKAVAVAHGEPVWSRPAEADTGADAWDKRRQEARAARVAESKRSAVAKYPALADANSEINTRFVFRYKLMVKDNDPRLKTTNWPELLADDCAAASAVRAQPKLSATKLQTLADAHPNHP